MSSVHHLFIVVEPRVHVALQLDSMEEDLVRMATELMRQANQPHEIQRELQKACDDDEERAKVAELNNRDAVKFWRGTYTADCVDKKSFAEFLGEVETYLSVLAPGLLSGPLLDWTAAFRDQPIVLSDVEACVAAHGRLRLEPEGGVRGARTLSAQSMQR